MPGGARRHQNRRHRRRNCRYSVRTRFRRPRWSIDARNSARYAGALRAHTRGILSAQQGESAARGAHARKVLKQETWPFHRLSFTAKALPRFLAVNGERQTTSQKIHAEFGKVVPTG